MNADGGNALQALLPPDLYALYLHTSRKDPRKEQLLLLDHKLRHLGSRPHIGAPNVSEPRHTAVHRGTLREILLSGLSDVISEAEVVGYEERGDRVAALLADGSAIEGDLLVGFDGINSPLRRQMLPQVEVRETAVQTVFARSPLTPEIAAGLPPELFDGFIVVMSPQVLDAGVMALGAYDPRNSMTDAAARYAPHVTLAPVEPYMMLGGSIPLSVQRQVGVTAEEASPQQLKQLLAALTADWSPHIRGLVERASVDDIFTSRMRYLTVADPWTPSLVTLGGDAIHAMPPTLGAGANLALRDAQLLLDEIDAVRGQGAVALRGAVGEYERKMREYDFPILALASTQKGAASGFTPAGLIRFLRMVGIKNLITASRHRDDAF
jgi:2-polyprenyl-6-methoxyphenol hydroxylase-like FAD-dependent oxidoreductase